MQPNELKNAHENAVAAELRERWGYDEATIRNVLGLAARGVLYAESTIHEAIQLDAMGKGKSTAVRHAVTCNLGKTFEAVATFGMSLGGALIASPWISLLGLLLFLKQARDCLTVSLDTTSAMVVWAMLKIRQDGPTDPAGASLKTIRTALNGERRSRALPNLPEGEVWAALKELEKLGAVEEIARDKWEVVEIVHVNRIV